MHEEKDYTKLHAAMEGLGFKRTMPAPDGGPELYLPEGLYYHFVDTDHDPPRALTLEMYMAVLKVDPKGAKVVLVKSGNGAEDIFSMGLRD
jgi:hypothetical protein